MHKYLLCFLFLFTAFTSRAQNKANVKGRVTDSVSNKPIEFATVAILDNRDTSSHLIAYTITDKDGAFNLHNIPQGISVKVFISFVAYQPYRKILSLKAETLDLGTIKLNIKELNEVLIKGERLPIVIKKDTIEFNAEAFKVRPNAVVEDLLKKLPGLEVGADGGITVMGKGVTKVLVDGHEFFSSDTRMATKNIDADMIDKIQVYDDRENDPDHLVPESKLNKIINLKFKKAYKKSIFGKTYAGVGTSDHYQAGGLINAFRDTLQVSVLGSSNNLNNTGFDFNDLYTAGGLNRGGDAISRSGIAWGGGGSGKQKTTNLGFNINTDYGKKLKINLAYIYKTDGLDFTSLIKRQQFLADTTVFTQTNNKRTSNNYGHSISSTVVWQPNDKTYIRYTPYINISNSASATNNTANSYSNFVNPINNSASGNNISGNNVSFSQAFSYNKQLKTKGASFNLNHSLNISPRNNTNFDTTRLTSYVAALPSYGFRQLGDSRSRSTDANLSAGLTYPIGKKLKADLALLGGYNHSLDKISTYNYNPATGLYDSFLLEKSNDLTRNKWTQGINTGLNIDLPQDANIRLHFNTQFNQATNIFKRGVANINQQYVFFMPSFNFNFKGFSVDYSRNTYLPNIGDMIPYTVVFSPSSSVTGNPNLKPTSSNQFSLNYSKYNFQNGTSYNVRASAGYYQNSVFRQRTLDAQLVETSTPINRSGRNNINISSYFNKRLKKEENGLQLDVSTNLSASKGHDFFVLNRVQGFQDSYQVSLNEHVTINYKDVLEIDPQYTLNYTYSAYTGVAYANQRYITHTADARFRVNLPIKMNIHGDYSYRYNPLVPQGFQKSSNLLNISVARQFLKKDKGEIKLSCYDLLDQNISTYRSINQNTVTDTQSQIIRRYFMVTLQYKFTKSIAKSDAKPANINTSVN